MNANELPTPELLRRVIDRLVRDLSERRAAPLAELSKPVPLCLPAVEHAEGYPRSGERQNHHESQERLEAHAIPTFLALAAGAQDDAGA